MILRRVNKEMREREGGERMRGEREGGRERGREREREREGGREKVESEIPV